MSSPYPAAIIIIIRPPRAQAMAGNQAFLDAMTQAEAIGTYWQTHEPTKPQEDALMEIIYAMCRNSASELEAANDALLPLPS